VGTYRFVDDVTSDLTFEAEGRTLAELFAACAEALLAATVERPDAVRARETRSLTLADERLDWLLRRFLSELIFLRDAEGLLLRARRIEASDGGSPTLSAELAGEPLDLARHGSGTDVKAVTAHNLRVTSDAAGFSARVTLDV
jgi:SHS2 domain-containing protein